jgi:hypothetical protein
MTFLTSCSIVASIATDRLMIIKPPSVLKSMAPQVSARRRVMSSTATQVASVVGHGDS